MTRCVIRDDWPTVHYPPLSYRAAHHVMRLLQDLQTRMPGVTEDTTDDELDWDDGFSQALVEVAQAVVKATRGRQTYFKRDQTRT